MLNFTTPLRPSGRAIPYVPGKPQPPRKTLTTVDHIQPLTRTALAVMVLTEVLTCRRPGT